VEVGVSTDMYIDTSNGNLWTKASDILWVLSGNLQGPKGDKGDTGTPSPVKNYIFQRFPTRPDTPEGNNIPFGWFDAPPEGTDPLWSSFAWQSFDGITQGVWSLPIRLDGEQGDPGSIWHSGSGIPAEGLGKVGDFYLNELNGDVYEKTDATTWVLVANIQGPQGPDGPALDGDFIEIVDVLPPLPDANYPVGTIVILSTDGRLYQNQADVWVDLIQPADLTGTVRVVDALPALPDANYPVGSFVVLSTDGKLYENVADAWVAVVTEVTASIQSVAVLPTLPDADYPEGAMVRLTTDGYLYQNQSGSWVALTGPADLTGAVRTVAVLPTLPDADYPLDCYVLLSTDNKIYQNQAGSWVEVTLQGEVVPTIVPVATLPALPDVTYPEGTTVYNEADQTLYINVSDVWEPLTISASVEAALPVLADPLPALPDGVYPVGTVVFNSTDGKLYKNADNATWTPVVNTTDIDGTLSAGQIDSVNAVAITGQITETQIANDAITTPKIFAGSVSATKIAAGAISADKIAASAITADKIAVNAVTAGKIAADAVTAGTIAAGSISTTKLAADAVTANNIAAGAITTAKLDAAAITADKIAVNAVTAGTIATGAITTIKLAANAVTTEKITAGAVNATTIAANAITASKISTGAVTTAKLDAEAVSAEKIAANAITAGKLAVDAVTAGTIAAGAIQTDNFDAGSVTADAIATNAVTAAKIQAGAITTTKMTVNSINGDRIQTNTLTASKISTGTLAATLTLTGSLITSNTGHIRSGKTSYASTASGWWMGLDGGFHRLHIGAGSDRYLRWTGTQLETSKLVVNGSVIQNSPLDANAARIHVGGGRTAPFMIYDATNGFITRSSSQAGAAVATFPTLRSPTYGTGHEGRRLAFHKQDILIQGTALVVASGASSATLRFDFQSQIDSGSWTTFATKNNVLAQNGVIRTEIVMARYTTPAAWSSLGLRVLVTAVSGNGTGEVTFQGSYFTNNANESANIANTGAGGDTGGDISINPLPPGDWTNPAQ